MSPQLEAHEGKARVAQEVRTGISGRTPPSHELKPRREFEAGLKDIGCFKPLDLHRLWGFGGKGLRSVSCVPGCWDPALELGSDTEGASSANVQSS